jgi:hypothetical protein
LQTGRAEIGAEHRHRCVADHVARTGDRKRGDGHAAGQRLQQHQAERIGHARENEHVGHRIDVGQRLAEQFAEENRTGKVPLQRRALRPVADDDLRAGKIECEKGAEILFHRQTPDGQKNGTRIGFRPRLRPEQRRIDTVRAPASPPSSRGSADGTSAAGTRPPPRESAGAPKHIPESACGSSW